jgi:hypothetical protein
MPSSNNDPERQPAKQDLEYGAKIGVLETKV